MLTAWLKRKQIAKVDEHIYVLTDQRDSAIAGLAFYEARRRQLQAELFAQADPRQMIDAALLALDAEGE